MTSPVRLFHFTCDHGYAALGARGLLVPQENPTLFGQPLPWAGAVWLTRGDFESTGMGHSGATVCDRSAYRYVVTDTTHCEPWLGSELRHQVGADATGLELLGACEQWWVAMVPVPARLG